MSLPMPRVRLPSLKFHAKTLLELEIRLASILSAAVVISSCPTRTGTKASVSKFAMVPVIVLHCTVPGLGKHPAN
jgi:hypothetical protein